MARRWVIWGLVWVAVGLAVFAGTPPPGFVETVVVGGSAATGAVNATAIAYEPGTDNLWVVEKGSGSAEGPARVRVRSAATGVVSTALTIDCVDSRGERGILGIAFSPDYLDGPASRHVYLYYTRRLASSGPCQVAGEPAGSRNRVSRFLESGGTLSGEDVILDGPNLTGATNHNGGTIRFGLDGTLLVSMGDNDTDASANPLSRDLSDLRGKLLRVDPDGSIPADNPFAGDAGVREEIWAWGLRNVFRFAIDPLTGLVVIADVGENTWEAVYLGIAGADYGYPCLEGSHPFRSCTPDPPAGSVTQPIYEYGHFNETPPVSGRSITGGPVYRHTAFPAEYHGAYFFGDYVSDWIRRGRITEDNRLVDVELFMPDADRVVDMAVSPDGCFAWVRINFGGGPAVMEVCYAGGANGQPQARSAAAPQSGLAPLTVQFTGSDSSDPDDDTLLYDWDFDDLSGSTAADPLHTYDTNGVRQVTLTVDDQQGQPNSVDGAPPLRVVVGNRPPVVDITGTPADYRIGQNVPFFGTAVDPEEGSLGGARFSWSVVFHRDGVATPFLGPFGGVTSSGFKPLPMGAHSANVFYRIHLRATDTGLPLGPTGELSSAAFVDVPPRLSQITLAAAPAGIGLELALDSRTAVAPIAEDSVVGYPRAIAAPSPQTVGGRTYAFQSWSDGEASEHDIVTPATDTTYTATFDCIANCSCDGTEIALGIGWTMVGTAVDPDLSASELCTAVGAPAVEVDRYFAGGWESHICGLPFNDFAIEPGAGYFVRASTSALWCQSGTPIGAPLAIPLSAGWTAISLPVWAPALTAEGLCDAIVADGGTPVEVDRYFSGGWQGHLCGLPFNDFAIVPGEGYFVRSQASSVLTVEP